MTEATTSFLGTQIEIKPSDLTKAVDYKNVYANQSQVSVTAFDIQLCFSQASAPGGAISNELQTIVFLAPGQAKALASILTRVIEDYERQFGTIPVPPRPLKPTSEEDKDKK